MRRQHPALVSGTISLIDTPADIVAFLREADGDRALCVFNLGGAPIDFAPPAGWKTARVLASDAGVGNDGAVPPVLAPGSGFWAIEGK
ncbi:MAG: DUF3459 domain-containing protein [Rhizobiales bacterium]|nr:DUF3459 domain-containing protein [Hyphomicrobiales bacterium]